MDNCSNPPTANFAGAPGLSRGYGRQAERQPNAASFYHLAGCDLAGRRCQGTACFVARHLERSPALPAHSQEPRVYCLGQCHAAPAARNGVTPRPHVAVCAPHGIVLGRLANGGARTLGEYTAHGGYRALRQALTKPREAVLSALESSGLRGCGGAAFPTGRKWRAVSQQPAAEKVVIANADEGDAGAYIDRFLLEDDPFSLIEGMTLAAYAVGARQGWIYLRTEYPDAELILRSAIAQARAASLLGEHVLCRNHSFDIEIFVGHGSYVCGEETALLRSLAGRRPEVMARPPYPAEHGLFGQPTLINNVETLVSVPWIVRHGGEAYRALGFSQSRGTKAVSLNSLFRRPGLYEVEFGVSVRHIVEELGGGLRDDSTLKGLLIGGPLAGVVPPHLLDTRFGFEELRAIGAGVGHGGIVAFDQHTSIAELVEHVFSFGAYESCGKCTPCRLGSGRVERIFGQLVRTGAAPAAQGAEWQRLARALRTTSLCGHGTGLGEFAESVLRYYGEELAACFA